MSLVHQRQAPILEAALRASQVQAADTTAVPWQTILRRTLPASWLRPAGDTAPVGSGRP